jgi:hypothetical protein
MSSDPAPTKLKLSEPGSFNGSHERFCDWMREINIWIRGHKLTEDDDKILTAISYMKEGTAATWASRFVDDHMEDDTSLGSWKEFVAQLKATFEDHTASKKARNAVEHFFQGQRTIDDFFNKFEGLLHDAELNDNEPEKIRLLEKCVNSPIINSIYSSGSVPTDYKQYKDCVLNFARLWERRKEQLELERKSHSHNASHSQHTHPAAPRRLPTPTVTEKKTPSGIVYGGHGKPMDLDGLRKVNQCYNCGEVGHFHRDCPCPEKRKVNVRALMMELTSEEQAELKAEMEMSAAETAEDVTNAPPTDMDFV